MSSSYLAAITAVVIVSYLIGSIPFGFLIGKLRGIDIRRQGSGNIGATNVTRVVGPLYGKLCFFLDFLKGVLPSGTALFLTEQAHMVEDPYRLLARAGDLRGGRGTHLAGLPQVQGGKRDLDRGGCDSSALPLGGSDRFCLLGGGVQSQRVCLPGKHYGGSGASRVGGAAPALPSFRSQSRGNRSVPSARSPGDSEAYIEYQTAAKRNGEPLLPGR